MKALIRYVNAYLDSFILRLVCNIVNRVSKYMQKVVKYHMEQYVKYCYVPRITVWIHKPTK